MADSREIGMRVGAASNQAATVVAALATGGWVNEVDIPAKHAELTQTFLGTMENFQNGMTTAPAPQPVAVPAGVPQQVPQQQVAPAPQPAQQLIESAFPNTTSNTGYNTTPSGSTKPLKLAEHPELDAWLHQQCLAVGVTEVWDNRGKPNFVQAINEGRAKTPPPFRSATEGIDKAFWPPASIAG